MGSVKVERIGHHRPMSLTPQFFEGKALFVWQENVSNISVIFWIGTAQCRFLYSSYRFL
ncbi:MAG: hypothetical protein QG588_417 [Candidatus Poribacteria bacterium]|nr:hypothetical protein [Candidatus Poribacteria bacterium]